MCRRACRVCVPTYLLVAHVEVVLTRTVPSLDDGVFLTEEQSQDLGGAETPPGRHSSFDREEDKPERTAALYLGTSLHGPGKTLVHACPMTVSGHHRQRWRIFAY